MAFLKKVSSLLITPHRSDIFVSSVETFIDEHFELFPRQPSAKSCCNIQGPVFLICHYLLPIIIVLLFLLKMPRIPTLKNTFLAFPLCFLECKMKTHIKIIKFLACSKEISEDFAAKDMTKKNKIKN